MTKLTINDFACIKTGEVIVSQFTVLIGPQASGKSVVAKLIYFFNEILSRPTAFGQTDYSFSAFVDRSVEDFVSQFPESAWGRAPFRISYEAGPFSILVVRDRRAKPGLRIEYNPEFQRIYEEMTAEIDAMRPQSVVGARARLEYEKFWPIQQRIEAAFHSAMGPDFVWHQIFVPAGRSFFTTLGKTAIALGSTVLTDSITQRFGRLITSLRDDDFLREGAEIQPTSTSILGGKVVKDGDREVLESPDGRRIPLSLMSSGQQEFFPLATALAYARMLSAPGLWVFIEEPEAHLFPKAQSELIELLVDTATHHEGLLRMVITTHSPYSLSKINNLLKAGQLAQDRPDLAQSISELVPRNRWLNAESLHAYGLIDGVITPLLDEYGLIDAEYLDSVSSSLAAQFGDLLELEYAS